MKILVISSYLPYPLYSGGHIRLYNLIKELSKRHEITLICEKRHNQIEEHIKDMKKICKDVLVVERKKQWTLKNILSTGVSTYPFLMVGHTLPKMRQLIEEQLKKETYDLIHVETFYIMQNLPKTNLPVVLVEHNIEYLVYDRFVKVVPIFLRPMLFVDILKMRYWEEIFWKRATKLVAVSPFEQKRMKRADVALVPNGVDLEVFPYTTRKEKQEEKKILFIGDFKWIQNIDAAKFIIKKVWPEIKSKVKNQKLKVKLWVVGRNIPNSIKRNVKDEDIILDENATQSAASIYKKADVLLAPIRVGGGTSYKILESMAIGLPVVTTSLGAEGIEAKGNNELLIADTEEELAQATHKLLVDQSFAKTIAKNARQLIEEKYNWKYIVVLLEDVYKSAVVK